MDTLMYVGLFIVSLAVLLKASDWFIDSAELIGLSFGISPYIIGVTIIAFGTSLPELATSLISVAENESSIVVGNVVGSNITNILLILGVVAVMAKGGIRMEGQMIMEIDMPLLVSSSFLLFYALLDGNLSLLEAFLLLIGLAIFLVNSMKSGRQDAENRPVTSWKTYAMLIVGGVFVYFGADYTIHSISKLSEAAGIPSQIIALSMVSLGTSLPELVVSISAARKGKTSMAVGNVLGSNIFNTYAVMAIPRFMGDLEIPGDVLDFSLPFMVGITILFTVIALLDKIPRPAGAMLLLFYGFFILTLFQNL
jgi:cation:H+ antiporter